MQEIIIQQIRIKPEKIEFNHKKAYIVLRVSVFKIL